MVETKKLKDLTDKELEKCGWIEKIAYRGDTNWTMYDSETKEFSKIKRQYPEAYEEISVTMGKKWFALYREGKGKIDLIDIAKMDIGNGQEEAKKEIQEFTKKILDTGKFIFVLARKDTSYFSFVKAAATGEIEIYQDEELGSNIRDMIFVKADGKTDLSTQMSKYQEKLNEFIENKDKHKENRMVILERYIKELENSLGKSEVRGIIER